MISKIIDILNFILITILLVLFLEEFFLNIFKLLGNLKYTYLSNKKYNEKKVRKKLYKKLSKMIYLKKEINISKEFWIQLEEYNSYTTLKYIFTNNKISFVYRKDCDKYLYNYYDFNAHEDGFIDRWIDEIRDMFNSESKIILEDIVMESPLDKTKKVDVLRITSCI